MESRDVIKEYVGGDMGIRNKRRNRISTSAFTFEKDNGKIMVLDQMAKKSVVEDGQDFEGCYGGHLE